MASGMLKKTPWAIPMWTQSSTHMNMKYSSRTEKWLNWLKISMYAQCNPAGSQYVLFDCFVDFLKKENALTIANQEKNVQGRPSLRCSTVGWQLCGRWNNGSTSWEKLSNPRSHALFRPQNMQSRKKLTTDPLSIGGYHMSWRNAN